MRYRVVFEFQSDDSAMSDVYNCTDEQQALEKFDELKDSLMHAIDTNGSEVIDLRLRPSRHRLTSVTFYSNDAVNRHFFMT